MHLVTNQPHPVLVHYLCSLNIHIDGVDWKGRTPICRLSERAGQFTENLNNFYDQCLDTFIGLKAHVDIADKK